MCMAQATWELSKASAVMCPCGHGGLGQVKQDTVAVLQQGSVWTSP